MNLYKRLLFSLIYFKKPVWDTEISPPELLDFIRHNPPGRALDLGCGTGTNAITLAKNGWHTTGIDFVGRAIRQARKKAQQESLDVVFMVDDVTKLQKIHGKFDLILDIGCFHSLDPTDRKNYIKNLERLLSEKGTFLIYSWIADCTQDTSGLSESDLSNLANSLTFVDRQDGTERGQQPSAWLTYVSKNPQDEKKRS
jgi:cyclopropane fatty-acyl-phospholipid synthase-like methyltransferase